MTTIRAQELLGRRVYAADNRYLGRVQELVAERVGNELAVTGMLIGPATWLSRFGWTTKRHGRHVPWTVIDSLEPHIRLSREE